MRLGRAGLLADELLLYVACVCEGMHSRRHKPQILCLTFIEMVGMSAFVQAKLMCTFIYRWSYLSFGEQ